MGRAGKKCERKWSGHDEQSEDEDGKEGRNAEEG